MSAFQIVDQTPDFHAGLNAGPGKLLEFGGGVVTGPTFAATAVGKRTESVPAGQESNPIGNDSPTGELKDVTVPSAAARARMAVNKNDKYLRTFEATITILKDSGIHHLMLRPHREAPVLRQMGLIAKNLSVLQPFDMKKAMPAEDTSFLAKNIIPFHIWKVCSLLTGQQPTPTVFVQVVEKWTALKKLVMEELDEEDGNAMLQSPLTEHALGAPRKYMRLLCIDDKVRLNKPRLDGIVAWMEDLELRTKEHMRLYRIQKKLEFHRAMTLDDRTMRVPTEEVVDGDDDVV